MFNCSSSSKTHKIEEPSANKYLKCLKNKNCMLRFLLLLPDEDYNKCIYSKKDMIWARRSKFPGKLIIENFENSDNLPYFIEGPPLPRQLYVMLPKEKLFIPSTNFTSRYIDSKMSELKQLFVILRAKTIKFTRNISNSDRYIVSGDIHARIPNSEITEGLNVSAIELQLNEQTNEMHFTENKDIPIIETLEKTNFHYLSREFVWQNIITRRLDNHLIYDKYTYKNQENKIFQSKFLSRLKLLGIDVNYDWESLQNLEIFYEIEYYPI